MLRCSHRASDDVQHTFEYLTYNDLTQHTELHMKRIFEFLGVAPHPVASNGTLKMGADNVYDGISNADEVRAALAGTVWEI